jgi:hypothetical protein
MYTIDEIKRIPVEFLYVRQFDSHAVFVPNANAKSVHIEVPNEQTTSSQAKTIQTQTEKENKGQT